MSTVGDAGPDVDPSFFDGRLLIEVEGWDATMHVGLAPDLMPPEYRFQGGLSFVRGFELNGRVLAPPAHRGKQIRAWLSPFGPEIRFGPDTIEEVGQIHVELPHPEKPDFSATLLIPEGALAMTATCLGSAWRYLHIWTANEDNQRASVSAFSFSQSVHRNLDPWVRGE